MKDRHVKFSDEEWDVVKAGAKARGMSPVEFVRHCVSQQQMAWASVSPTAAPAVVRRFVPVETKQSLVHKTDAEIAAEAEAKKHRGGVIPS